VTSEFLVLGEALEVLIDNRGKNPPFVQNGVPAVSGMSVRPGWLDLTDAKAVSVETWKQWMPTPTQPNDVVLTSEAPLGRVALIRTSEPLLMAQRVFCLRGRAGVLDSRFLFYAFRTEQVQSDLASRATGSTVLGIRQPELLKVRIPGPSYKEQRAIADVLGALDDKIDANDRIVATVARLTDALFMDARRHVDQEESTFEEVAFVGGGGTPSTSNDNFWGGSISWATPTDVTALPAPYLNRTSRSITKEGLGACASSLYQPGSILMTSRATIGAFAIAQVPTAVNQGFIVVNAKKPQLQWWLYHEMRARIPEFLSYANGATFQELSRGSFKRLRLPLPTHDQAVAFDQVMAPLHLVAAETQIESERLAHARDDLLPLLMSGKIRIKDAEAAVAEVV
jgi:type I restriction enzyme S subunit